MQYEPAGIIPGRFFFATGVGALAPYSGLMQSKAAVGALAPYCGPMQSKARVSALATPRHEHENQ